MFPVCRQSGIGLDSKQTASLPLCVLHTAEQLVVGVLDGAVVVVGEVWQRRPVLAQCVVAGVGVVMVVTVRNIWNGIFRVDGAAGGEGDSRCVVLLFLLPAAVEQQQSQQQDHQNDKHNDAGDGPPRLPLSRIKTTHDAPRLLEGVLLAVVASVFTHTVSSKSVTEEVGWTGTGLSTELAETSRITRFGAVDSRPAR